MMTLAIGEDSIHRDRPRATLRLQRYCTHSIPTERCLTSAAEKGFYALGYRSIQTTPASSLLLWRLGEPQNVIVRRGLFIQARRGFSPAANASPASYSTRCFIIRRTQLAC